MASTIDSGIDTGNDSNDSSLQDKLSKMDLERLQIPSTEFNNDISDSLDEGKEKCVTNGFNRTEREKVDEPPKSTSLIPSPSASGYQTSSLPESRGRNFNCTLLMSSNEGGGAMYIGPFSREYADRDLVTKVRHAFKLKCMRRYHHSTRLAHLVRMRETMTEQMKICRAVTHNNTDAVKEMLMAGVSPNCYDTFKRTPLHQAACMGYADMVKLLLDYGADPNAKDSIGNTPLHLAACTNHVRVVSLLMEAGTRLSERDLSGHSPLQLAITKLNIMKRSVRPNLALQEQITQVVQMMTEYMKRKEQVEPALLSRLFSVMQVKEESEDVESNIQSLLSNLSLSSRS